MSYNLFFNREQSEIIPIAASIWKSLSVKNKITNWHTAYQSAEFEEAFTAWQELTMEVSAKVNRQTVPQEFQDFFILTVIEIGKKVYNWYRYMQYEFPNLYKSQDDELINQGHNLIKCIDLLFWTSNGTVDEVQILNSNGLKNFNLDISLIYNLKCKDVLKKEIDNLWEKSSFLEEFDDQKFKDWCKKNDGTNETSYFNNLIFSYWNKCRNDHMDRGTEQCVSHYLFNDDLRRIAYNEKYSAKHKIFLLFVYEGYSTAVKYLWKKLTQEERDVSILYTAYMAVYCCSKLNRNNIEEYKREKYLEILIFLINHMTLDQKESFFKGDSISVELNNCNIEIKDMQRNIFSMILIWPWRQLFMRIFIDILPHINDTEPIVEALFEISKTMIKSKYEPEQRDYENIFHEVWTNIPESSKQKMIQKVYEKFIITDDYELLDQLMEKVLSSEEEKIYLKNRVDNVIMFLTLIDAERFNSADRFLNWHFKTPKEIKDFKERFKFNLFFAQRAFVALNLSNGNLTEAKRITSKLLNFMLESEAEITFFRFQFNARAENLIGKEIMFQNEIYTISKYILNQIKQVLLE